MARAVLLGVWLAAVPLAGTAASPPGAVAGDGVTLDVLVPPALMHAIEGINFDLDGTLLGTSIHGQSVYRIDVGSGAVSVAVGPPHGESDDVAVGPAGTPAAGILAWTAQFSGEIRIQRPGAAPEVALPNAPRVNPIAFSADGRLFTAQVGAGDDTLWELDVVGGKPPRRVASGQGRLNGFGFGPDGRLYAPQFGTDRLVAIDVDRGEYTTIASGVGSPAAVKVAPNGDVYSVDYLKGDLWITPKSGAGSRIVASLREPIDSLAIARDGTIYVSNVADSSVHAVDPSSGRSRTVVHGVFTVPLGMALATLEGAPRLLVADPFGYRFVDPKDGAVTRPDWAANRGASSAVAADARFIAYSVFSASGSGRVRQLDRASDSLVVESTAVGAPRGIALTSQGEMIVADAREGRLLRVTAQGVATLATGLEEPVALLLERDGVALVTEARAGRVTRVDLADGRRTVLAEGLARPTGLARLPDGRLVVVEPDAGRVVAVDPRSGARTRLATGLKLSLDGLDLPKNTNAGVVVDRDGRIFVACPGDNSIVRISVAGQRRTGGKSK
jgi:sugar lactone lactonase YvrE